MQGISNKICASLSSVTGVGLHQLSPSELRLSLAQICSRHLTRFLQKVMVSVFKHTRDATLRFQVGRHKDIRRVNNRNQTLYDSPTALKLQHSIQSRNKTAAPQQLRRETTSHHDSHTQSKHTFLPTKSLFMLNDLSHTQPI